MTKLRKLTALLLAGALTLLLTPARTAAPRP